MRDFLIISGIFIGILILMQYCDSKKDPYEEGMHMDYSIVCNDGFKYKHIRGGYLPCLHSDGTPLKCNEKRH